MKALNLSSKNKTKETKILGRKASRFDKQISRLNRQTKRLRIVQSVHAGHIRGGHSFH